MKVTTYLTSILHLYIYSKACIAGPLLSDILLNLVQESLLHSLIPYLAPDKADKGLAEGGQEELDSRTSSTSCSDVGGTSGDGGKRNKGGGGGGSRELIRVGGGDDEAKEAEDNGADGDARERTDSQADMKR